MEVVGEAPTGDEAVDQARTLKPHVVLMDLSMPGSSGLDSQNRRIELGYENPRPHDTGRPN